MTAVAATPVVRERPILFSGAMVRAIRDGRKSQTRRVVKPQPDAGAIVSGPHANGDWCFQEFIGDTAALWGSCPYGAVGDRLWVRENWQIVHDAGADAGYSVIRPTGGSDRDGTVVFAADHKERLDRESEQRGTFHWRPSIHMPRWASRLTLEITGVRVERLQAISEADVSAEGIEEGVGHLNTVQDRDGGNIGVAIDRGYPARDQYHDLWDSLNAKRGYSWESNPWVWVVEFRRIDA